MQLHAVKFSKAVREVRHTYPPLDEIHARNQRLQPSRAACGAPRRRLQIGRSAAGDGSFARRGGHSRPARCAERPAAARRGAMSAGGRRTGAGLSHYTCSDCSLRRCSEPRDAHGGASAPLARHGGASARCWAGLAGALRGADQRPAPRAPGHNERPAPSAPELPGPCHDARVIRRQGPARARSPTQPGSAQLACSTLRLKSLKNQLMLHGVQHLKHVLCHNKSTCCAWCKAARPIHSVRPKIRLTASGTDLLTILRCFLSFRTVVTSRNIIMFKIKFPGQKTAIRVMHALKYLVPLAAARTLPPHVMFRFPR
jgi:hypothetical protein